MNVRDLKKNVVKKLNVKREKNTDKRMAETTKED